MSILPGNMNVPLKEKLHADQALASDLPKKQPNKRKMTGEYNTGKEICYHISTDLDMSFDSLASNLRA